jgi:hypothetical protein
MYHISLLRLYQSGARSHTFFPSGKSAQAKTEEEAAILAGDRNETQYEWAMGSQNLAFSKSIYARFKRPAVGQLPSIISLIHSNYETYKWGSIPVTPVLTLSH